MQCINIVLSIACIACFSFFRMDKTKNFIPQCSFALKRHRNTCYMGYTIRAVKKVLSSRLIMDSGWLWNSHQRHKFLRAEVFRDILKIRVLEMAFPEVYKRYFPSWMPCYFVRVHTRLRIMLLKCPRHSKTSHGSNVLQI